MPFSFLLSVSVSDIFTNWLMRFQCAESTCRFESVWKKSVFLVFRFSFLVCLGAVMVSTGYCLGQYAIFISDFNLYFRQSHDLVLPFLCTESTPRMESERK